MNLLFQPIWQGEDVFVLGGGPSVRAFPLSRLKGRKVIGCNDAYLLGEDIVNVLIFGDETWYRLHCKKHAFEAFGGTKITLSQSLEGERGLVLAPKRESGFHRTALGWNGNTGMAAINLALVYGAKRVFLIGFDMCVSDKGRSNWHKNGLDKPTSEHYKRYMSNAPQCAGDAQAKWPEVSIINLNPSSKLEAWPRMNWDSIFDK